MLGRPPARLCPARPARAKPEGPGRPLWGLQGAGEPVTRQTADESSIY